MNSENTGDMTPKQLEKIRELASQGYGLAEIAGEIGLPTEWSACGLHYSPESKEAYEFGSMIADCKIEKALYDAAIAGDVRACIFWLSNRLPEEWRITP